MPEYYTCRLRRENYFSHFTMNCFLLKFMRRLLFIFLWSVCIEQLSAQGCGDALNNQICAETAQPIDSLSGLPLAYSCFNAVQTSFYSFHTNNIATDGEVNISVHNYDCDDFLGNDSIQILVVALIVDSLPCDPNNYVNPICASDSATEFSLSLNSLANNQDYLIIVGSNHDSTNYGPCLFDVNISGTAVDIDAGITNGQIIISLGENAQLAVTGADSTATITWTPAEYLDDPYSATPTATPEQTTVFQVTASVGGCTLTDVVTLTVSDPVVVYNTFSPNGDGINDAWRIKFIEKFPNCQIEVFDRWGQSIFKSVGYAQPWDGTFKGRFLPTGAYFYVMELNSLEVTIPPLTGTVSIVH